jgi:hypothetical protein
MMLRCLMFDYFIFYDARYLFRDLNQVFGSNILKPSPSRFNFWHSSIFLIIFPSIYRNARHLAPQEDISS